MNRRLLGVLFASYNNSRRFDEALDCFEKFKSYYEGKMRLWYYDVDLYKRNSYMLQNYRND